MSKLCGLTIALAGCGTVAKLPDAGTDPDAGHDVPEVCNGRDDNNSGIVDEGCPREGPVVLTAGVSSPLYGATTTANTTNTIFTLDCPPGTAVTGFYGRAYESVDAIGLRCGVPMLRIVDTQASAYAYALTIAPASDVAVQGGSGGTAFEATCWGDAMVGSLRFWTGSNANGTSIYGFAYDCSGAITITGSPGAFTVVVGSTTPSDRIGTGDGSITETLEQFGCPSGSVVTGVTGYYGPWPPYPSFITVNGLSVRCAAITAQLISV